MTKKYGIILVLETFCNTIIFVIDGRKEDVLSVSSIFYLSPLSISLKLTGTLSRFQMESGILTQK